MDVLFDLLMVITVGSGVFSSLCVIEILVEKIIVIKDYKKPMATMVKE